MLKSFVVVLFLQFSMENTNSIIQAFEMFCNLTKSISAVTSTVAADFNVDHTLHKLVQDVCITAIVNLRV